MAARAFAVPQGGLEAAENALLFIAELNRGFHHNVAIEITRTGALDALDPLPGHAESGTGLSSFGNGETDSASRPAPPCRS